MPQGPDCGITPSLQNNLSNPPTPPSSLPPTPPPSVQQKMVNGVTSSEELPEQPKDPALAREPEGHKGRHGAVPEQQGSE